MTCGRVSPISTRLTFEELAVLFEGSTASGAERAYRKAVEHLACLLTEAGVLHVIRLKRKSQTKHKKKIAAAVYLYQVDNDGEWGEISFDFEAGTAEIIRLAEWDTTISKVFATKSSCSCYERWRLSNKGKHISCFLLICNVFMSIFHRITFKQCLIAVYNIVNHIVITNGFEMFSAQ